MNQEQEESTETLDHIQDPPATPSQADTDKNPEEILDSVGILMRRNSSMEESHRNPSYVQHLGGIPNSLESVRKPDGSQNPVGILSLGAIW